MKNHIFTVFILTIFSLININLLAQNVTKQVSYGKENHKIIQSIPDLDQKYGSDRKVRFKIYLKEEYADILKKNPDKLKWTISNLPNNAKFEPDNAQFDWQPTPEQIGPWNIKFKVEYLDISDEINVNFVIEENWNSFFIPGLAYTNLFPEAKTEFGVFHGLSVEYLISAWIHRNENRGPSHGRFYLKLDLLRSDNKDVSDAFNYSLGINMSLERNPSRSYLIPFFGLELGGFYQKKFDNFFMLTPLAGIWLYCNQNIFVNLYAGYMLPTTGFETIRGLRSNLGFNISLW